ncbi:MAG: ABC transporter ATP-binding protein [Desulfobacteraceae bacterium]|nr:ABC transporter ATP-binding protein [Desulfobacteraceae bacterium]MBC2750506.1 ABC transporter ATP-binding protein [Desulfobacteraceae bacterium]
MSDQPIVQIDALSKSYPVTAGRRIEILKGIELTLTDGDSLAVVGASGIGKSTLLQILGTLDRPDSGRMFFRGIDVFKLNHDRLAKFRNQSVGFVFQFHHLLAEFTAIENVMMPVLISGEHRDQAHVKAIQILERVGLGHRLEHRVTDLSGGEQQRVALARALILRPALLLADEPTGNLDKSTGRQIHKLLLELNQEMQMTIVIVTHNPDLAALMARRITIVDGALVELN